MYYQTRCVQTTIEEWQQLITGARKASYKRLVQRIKHEQPNLHFSSSRYDFLHSRRRRGRC